MNKVIQFLHDGGGYLSSMRLIFILFWAVFILIWAGLSIYKNEIAEVPQGMVALLIGVSAAKVTQSFSKNDGADN